MNISVKSILLLIVALIATVLYAKAHHKQSARTVFFELIVVNLLGVAAINLFIEGQNHKENEH